MKLKQIIKDKKGVVMEMTIIYVLIASLFCMVILAVSLTIESHNRYIAKRTQYQMELERIGDAFVAGEEFGEDYSEIFKSIDVSVDKKELSVRIEEGEPERLHVTLDGDGRVTRWNLNLD